MAILIVFNDSERIGKMREAITGSFRYDGGTVALLETESGKWVAAEPRIADDLLTLWETEDVEISYEPWQVVA